MGRAVEGVQSFDRWEVVEAFAMFTREGSLPVWKAFDRHATLMSPSRSALQARPLSADSA